MWLLKRNVKIVLSPEKKNLMHWNCERGYLNVRDILEEYT